MCRKPVLALVTLSLLLASAAQAADPSLIGWWKLNSTEGTVAADSSGNDNDGTLRGDATWTEDGYWGSAILLDGAGDYVDCGNSDIYNIRDAVTLAAWVHADPDFAYPDWSGIIMRGGSPYDTFALYYNGTNPQIGFKLTETSAEWHAIAAPGLFDREWHHVSATWDGQTKVVYLDAQVLTSVGSTGQIQTSNGRLLLGAGRDLSPPTHYLAGRIDDARVYDRALTREEIQLVMLDAGEDELAVDPLPGDGQTDVPRDVVLGWTAGKFANTHDVYLGTNFDDVNTASRADPMGLLLSQGQSDAAYDPDMALQLGQTYYWRIDEVNAAPDNTIFKGEVWSFTIEPVGYPIEGVIATSNTTSNPGEGPERTVDGSGLNENDEHSTDAPDMWLGVPGGEPVQIQFEFDRIYKLHEILVWNYNVMFELVLGFGLKDVTVEYSEDGAAWTAVGDVEFAQGTATADYTANTVVDMGGVAARFVRFTANSGHGPMGQFGLSEVRFLYIPVQAREPQPANGAVDVVVNGLLSWRAGREAVSHDVYLGADAQARALVDSIGDNSYAPDDLQFGTTYCWRIDEVNEAEAISTWQGDVWCFSTQEYVVIDDMESYDDEDNTIFDAWLDGFVNGTGSTVGYFEAPFAEQTIVNSGKQSMPLEYDNTAGPFYSEAELDLGSANWNTNGADTLRLFVSGQPPAFFEGADGSILMNAIGTDIWGSADEFRYVYKTLTGDGSMIARVDDLDGSPSTWAKAGVMVRQSTAVGATHSFMCMTGGDGNGASWQGRPTVNAASVNNDATSAVAPPYWVKIDRTGNSLTGSISADGENWTQIGDARSIAMNDPVLVGLALTSHNASQATSAEFSNISTTGNVGGAWQVAEIGVAQPEGNGPEPLYVAIEDTSGKVAVATNPDSGVTGRSGWNEWRIPFGDLAGANLGRVAVLYIGVGDRDNPTAGGKGLIFIDDVGFGHPALP